MSVSKGTRFEVFRRDRFTCAYCGRTPPEVLLQADHIVPRADGGPDDIENLITACADCNLGKGAKRLDESTTPIVRREAVEELEERLEQAKAYVALVTELRAVTDEIVGSVMEVWAEAFHAKPEDDAWVFTGGERFPNESSVRTILKHLPLDQVIEAVWVTANWSGASYDRTCRYFYGVCWRRIREREGRE